MRTFSRLQGILFVGLLGVTHAGVTTFCKASDNCPSGECCMRNNFCAPLEAEGSQCYVINDELWGYFGSSVFKFNCPCKEGYICESIDDNNDIGTCIKPCSLTSDCGEGQCCALMTDPARRAKRSSSRGTCKNLGTANETCFVAERIGSDFNFLCPCASGLYCQGTGQGFDNYLAGEDGVCTYVDTIDKAIPGK